MTTQSRYYKLYDDVYIPGRWHLRTPVDGQGQWVATAQFTAGRALELQGAIHFPVKPAGVALEFSLSSFGIPVVHGRVVALFERLGLQNEVQFIPVEVEGQTERWFILNALQVIRCIDDTRCEEVVYWLPEDNRPELVGQYRNVRGLKVDPSKIGDANIFRPWGWEVVLIVSERVKQAMEEAGITGTKFLEV